MSIATLTMPKATEIVTLIRDDERLETTHGQWAHFLLIGWGSLWHHQHDLGLYQVGGGFQVTEVDAHRFNNALITFVNLFDESTTEELEAAAHCSSCEILTLIAFVGKGAFQVF